MHPGAFLRYFPSDIDLWLSLGSYNLVIRPHSPSYAQKIFKWLRTHPDCRYEVWQMEEGRIRSTKISKNLPSPEKALAELSKLTAQCDKPDLLYHVSEYSALMASAMTRAGQVLPGLLDEFVSVHEYIKQGLLSEDQGSEEWLHEQFDTLATINAALSRLSSQTFSGISPIKETECHFWTHSLLGTAVANLAVWQFCRFPLEILGQSRLVQKFCRLAAEPIERDLIDIDPDDSFWDVDFLSSAMNPRTEGR